MDNDAARLMSIGVFAAASGITSSALRFYDDTGVLSPIKVDSRSGYRLYSEEQLHRAELVYLLREAQLPLAVIKGVLDGTHADPVAVIKAHIKAVSAGALRAVSAAHSALNLIDGASCALVAVIPGFELARAFNQVRVSAAPSGPFHSVALFTVPGAVNLITTDRYRLSWRTLLPASPTTRSSTSHLSLESVEEAVRWLSDKVEVELTVRQGEARAQCMESGEQRTFMTVDDDFPDYSAVVAALPQTVSRAVVPRAPLLSAVESRGHLRLAVVENGISVDWSSGAVHLPAMSWGPPLTQSFDSALLHPVLEQSVGPDVVLEMSAEAGPLRVRSADTSDLLSVLMPIKPAPDSVEIRL